MLLHDSLFICICIYVHIKYTVHIQGMLNTVLACYIIIVVPIMSTFSFLNLSDGPDQRGGLCSSYRGRPSFPAPTQPPTIPQGEDKYTLLSSCSQILGFVQSDLESRLFFSSVYSYMYA